MEPATVEQQLPPLQLESLQAEKRRDAWLAQKACLVVARHDKCTDEAAVGYRF